MTYSGTANLFVSITMKIGYARVSTKEQSETNALEQQIARLRSAGAEQILYDVKSGRNKARKEYNRVLKLVREGIVTEIIITRIDRLGRSASQINQAIEIFQNHKVKINVLDSPIGSLDGAFQWLTINNIAMMAEFESRLLEDRVKHGLNHYRENLKYFSTPPFGYTKDENSKLIPHPRNWKIAKEICIKLKSQSKTSISRWLASEHGVKMYPTSFRRWALNPCLRGHTVYRVDGKEVIHHNTHQPLLTEREYQEIAQTTKIKARTTKSDQKIHFLAGLFRCGVCGAAMSKSGSHNGKNVIRFQCVAYKKFGLKGCTNQKTLADSIVRRETIKELQRYAYEVMKEVKTYSQSEEDDPELIELNHQLQGLRSLGNNPAIQDAIKRLEKQISDREHHKTIRTSIMEEDEKLLYAFFQADFWQELADEELRSICLRFISSVKYVGGRELKWEMLRLV